MKKIDQLHEMYPDLELLQADGFDDAIIGIEPLSGKVIYDIDKMVIVLNQEGLSSNVLNAYVGENTPIYIQTLD